jgi:hypothetical protein
MKWIKTLLAAFVAIALTTTPSIAGETTKYDANGNAWLVDEETAATLGAGSGEGAIIGEVESRNKFDLQLGLRAVGSTADDDASSESALTGIKGFYRPAAHWRIGGSMQWDTVDRTAIHFTLPLGLQLFPNPWRNQIFWLNANLLPTYTIRTGSTDGLIRSSAWSWVPGASMSIELPMGETSGWSTEFGAGAGIPITIEGVTDEALNGLVNKVVGSIDFAVNIRFR